MADLKLTRVRSGAALVKKLLDKADNGDATLTLSELKKAYRGNRPPDQWTVDVKTHDVLQAAVNKKKSAGERSVGGIKQGVDEALAEIKAADLDRDGQLTAAEQKKVKTPLGRSLLAFSEAHGDKSVTWFKIKAAEEVYVPSRPFRAPPNASPVHWIDAAVKHFNGYSNDNSTHGPRPQSITRYVLGRTEASGLVAELEKLPAAKAKAALIALGKRINTPRPLTIEEPRRIYLDDEAQKAVGAFAKRLGVKVDLKGELKAPQFDYY